MKNDGLHSNHFGVVVHLGNRVEKIDWLTQTKSITHFQEGVAANVIWDTLFGVIEDEDGISNFDFFEVFTNEVIFNLGINFVLIICHVRFVDREVVEFVGSKNAKTALF